MGMVDVLYVERLAKVCLITAAGTEDFAPWRVYDTSSVDCIWDAAVEIQRRVYSIFATVVCVLGDDRTVYTGLLEPSTTLFTEGQ